MRQEMGREKFNKNFPGWERELQSEIGLDAFNRIFEGYDPNDTSDQEDYEEKWRYFEEKIDDEIYNFFSSLEEDLSSRIENTLDKDTVGGDVLYELYEMVDFKPDKISQMTELEPILNRFKFSANNKHVKTSINYSWKQHLEKVIKSISKLIMDDGGDPLLFIDYPNPITCLEAFKHLSDQYIAGLKTHHSPQIRLEVAKKMDTSTLKEMLKNETDRWAQGWMNVELRNRKDK